MDEVVGYTARFAKPGVSEPSALRLEGTGGPHVFVREREEYTFIIDGGDAREECFAVFAIDVAGNEAALAEPLCIALDPANVEAEAGCANVGAGWCAALLALSRIRRRR